MAQPKLKLTYPDSSGTQRDLLQELNALWHQHQSNRQADQSAARRQLAGLHKRSKSLAALCMGFMHEKGMGVEQDMRGSRSFYRLAQDCFQKQAADGDVYGQNNAGVMMVTALGGYQDEEDGFAELDKAATEGLPTAQFNAGVCRVTGVGTRADTGSGLALLETASKAGDANASSYIAQLLESGERGLPKNRDRAMHYYARAAFQDNAPYAERARLYLLGLEEAGGARHGATQMDWAALKSDLGEAGARCRIALYWCRSEQLTQFNRGLTDLNHMAERGDVEAISTLAELYLVGAPHREPDYDLAYRYALEAGEQGNASSCHIMGTLLRDELDRDQDLLRALSWFRKAAERGHPGAQYRLGEMLVFGQGGSKNLAEGYYWLTKAVHRSERLPRGLVSKVESRLPKKAVTSIRAKLADTAVK